MSCAQAAVREATADSLVTLRSRPRRVVLVGNANVGKSVLFGRLTGQYAVVSNYPGTTVAVTQGRAVIGGEVCDVIDTPASRALDGVLSEDELVSRRILEDKDLDLVIQVADARNIRRGLMLTSQLAAFGRPMILVLNMIDEAHAHGVEIDVPALQAELGVPVLETVATEGRGVAGAAGGPAARRRARRPRARSGPRDHVRWAHDLVVAVPPRCGRIRRRAGRSGWAAPSASR